MVLEDRPAQFDAFSVAARRPARAIRDSGLCRGNARYTLAVGADDLCGVSRIPDECGADFGDRSRRDPPPACRRTSRSDHEWPLTEGMARADGAARAPGVTIPNIA